MYLARADDPAVARVEVGHVIDQLVAAFAQ
jgi:hypothetical protein